MVQGNPEGVRKFLGSKGVQANNPNELYHYMTKYNQSVPTTTEKLDEILPLHPDYNVFHEYFKLKLTPQEYAHLSADGKTGDNTGGNTAATQTTNPIMEQIKKIDFSTIIWILVILIAAYIIIAMINKL
jgi:hypothetical protein